MDEKSYMKKVIFLLLLLLFSYHKQEYLSNYGFHEICLSKVSRGVGREAPLLLSDVGHTDKSSNTEMFLINCGISLAKKKLGPMP